MTDERLSDESLATKILDLAKTLEVYLNMAKDAGLTVSCDFVQDYQRCYVWKASISISRTTYLVDK